MKILPEGETAFLCIMSMARYYTKGVPTGEHVMVRHDVPGGAYSEMMWLDGKLHNHEGPAVTSFDSNGGKRELYCINGLLDRKDGPAYISTDASGNKTEEYYKQGKFIPTATTLKNGPKPAIMFCVSDDAIHSESSDYVDLGPLDFNPHRDENIDAQFEEVKAPTKPQRKTFDLLRIFRR